MGKFEKKFNELTEAKKELIRTDVNIRDAYYSLTDGVWTMKDVADQLDDKELKKLVKAVDTAFDKMGNHLNNKYIWD